MADLKAKDPNAAAELMQCFYDPHIMMAIVLEPMYAQGTWLTPVRHAAMRAS
jgi:hypothetical protein